MAVKFTSDLHLLHRTILKYRTQFATVLEHDQFMLDKIAQLTKRDTLFVIGDFIFEDPNFAFYINQIRKMPCHIKLLLGNHDSLRCHNSLSDNIELMLPIVNYKALWLSHCPIHPSQFRERKGNIHGHLHEERIDDPRYLNVNIDVNNYEFVPLEQIQEHFKLGKQHDTN